MSLFIIVGTVAKILNRRLKRKIVLRQTTATSTNDESLHESLDLSLLSVHDR